MHRTRSSAAWGVLAAFAAMGVGVALLPDGPVDDLLMRAGGPGMLVCVLTGLLIHRPRQVLPWLGLAYAAIGVAGGDAIVTHLGAHAPYPSVADAAWLSAYPGFIAAVMGFLRAGGRRRDWSAILDVAIVAVAATTLCWTFLVVPTTTDGLLAADAKAVSVAYIVADLALLSAILRLSLGGGPGGASARLLSAGMLVMFAIDSVYGYQGLKGTYTPGGVIDGAYVVAYGMLGAVALHPSMRRLTEPLRHDGEPRLSAARLLLLGGAALLIPCVQVTGAVGGGESTFVALGIGSAMLFALVCLRLAALMTQLSAARERESVLRRAGEALVSATDRRQLSEAAVTAARRLAGHDRVDLRFGAPDDPALAAALATGEPVEVPARGWLAPLIVRGELRGALQVHGPAPAAGARRALETLAREVMLAAEAAAGIEESVRADADARLAALIRHSSDLTCVTGPDGTITYASPSALGLLGLDAEALVGTSLAALSHPEDRLRASHLLAEAAGTDAPVTGALRLRHADGTWREGEIIAANLLDDPAVGGLVVNVRDASERKAFERELAHRAFHDALTGLPNRVLFRNRVEHALERVHRDGAHVAVLFLDLDDLKAVNDSLGHAVGDALLCEVGARVRETVRGADTVARLGGDEYAVLLDGIPQPHEAALVADRILEALAAPVDLEGHAMPIRASIGIAHVEPGMLGTAGTDQLLRNADAAMYLAKDRGKGRYQVFMQALHDAAVERLALKSDLQRALEEREFHLAYQPVVELATGAVAGVEVLARWTHPSRGAVSPGEFIPLAEESGLIVPLGTWILDEACAHAARLQAACPQDPPLGVSVNLSARQLQRPQIVDDVRAALAASGIPPSSLTLELTESMLVADVDLAVLRLHELRGTGVRLAIDDFGTGYSSLTYLRHFPLDTLKVDKSFVDDIRVAGGTGPLTAAILDLARVLELRPIAEGIEDAAQLEALRDLGCELGQGFALHRPMDAAAVLALVREQAAGRAPRGATPAR